MAAAPITARGYAHSDLGNVTEEVLFARVLGLDLPFAAADVPSLYDYTGPTWQGDPTGRNSSSKALRQLAADCSSASASIKARLVAGGVDAELVQSLPGVAGVASPGTWVHDDLTLDFWSGAGLVCREPVVESSTPGLFGCTILRPHRTGYDLEVPFAVHAGNRFVFNVHYPDRLAEQANIDATGAGELVAYAPTFATDHCNDYAGVPDTGANVNFFHGDTCITGAGTGVYLGEAPLNEEAWVVSPSGRRFSTQNGRSSGGYYWNIRGMCLDRGIVRNRIPITAVVESTGNGFGPQAWAAAAAGNLHAYLQKNCVFHTMGHRATGFRVTAKIRHCQTALRFRGGPPPIGWTSGSGRDNGRYAAGEIHIRTEQCPNLVTWEDDAWPTGVSLDYNGLGKDFFDQANTVPLIRHLTDKDIAGDLRKPSTDHPGGWWRPCTNFGVMIDYKVVSRTSAGPVLVIPDCSPQGVIAFQPGSRFSSWNVNNKHATNQSAYGFQHLAAENNMVLSFLGAKMNCHFGADYIFWGTQDGDGDPASNLNYGMIKGVLREAMQYFGYDASNIAHACNIQPFDGHGDYFPIGFPDGDDDDDDDDGDGEDAGGGGS